MTLPVVNTHTAFLFLGQLDSFFILSSPASQIHQTTTGKLDPFPLSLRAQGYYTLKTKDRLRGKGSQMKKEQLQTKSPSPQLHGFILWKSHM